MTVCGPSLSAVAAGQTYDLNDGSEIRLLAYDLGLSAVRRLAQRSPLQAGDTDLGYRVDPRFVELAWVLKGAGASDAAALINYRDIRERFMEVWVPRDDAVQVIFGFEDRTRAVDLHLDGMFNWGERSGVVEKVSGVFKASDPRLYDPTIHNLSFSLEGQAGGAGWTIPWAIPWAIGDDTLNLALSFLYAGGSRLAAQEFPRITVFGPIDDLVIAQETTGETLDFTANGGLSLATSSDWVEIDLAGPDRRDAKTVRDETGASVDQYLTAASDLATWHLAPAGERLPDGSWADGNNTIRVSGTGVTSQTLVSMNYYDRYNGV